MGVEDEDDNAHQEVMCSDYSNFTVFFPRGEGVTKV